MAPRGVWRKPTVAGASAAEGSDEGERGPGGPAAAERARRSAVSEGPRWPRVCDRSRGEGGFREVSGKAFWGAAEVWVEAEEQERPGRVRDTSVFKASPTRRSASPRVCRALTERLPRARQAPGWPWGGVHTSQPSLGRAWDRDACDLGTAGAEAPWQGRSGDRTRPRATRRSSRALAGALRCRGRPGAASRRRWP